MSLVGRYVTDTETVHVVRDSRYRFDQTRPGVVFCHFSGGDALSHWSSDAESPSYMPLLRALCDMSVGHGLPLVGFNGSGIRHWGNDAFQTKMTAAVAYLRGTVKASAAPVHVVAVSMGGMALNWVRSHLSDVASFTGLYPATNLDQIHDLGGLGQTHIETAYTDAAGYEAALPTHDPFANAAAYRDAVWMRLWYSSADTTVPPDQTEAFAAAVGGSRCSTVSLGASVHGDMDVLDAEQVKAFVGAHL